MVILPHLHCQQVANFSQHRGLQRVPLKHSVEGAQGDSTPDVQDAGLGAEGKIAGTTQGSEVAEGAAAGYQGASDRGRHCGSLQSVHQVWDRHNFVPLQAGARSDVPQNEIRQTVDDDAIFRPIVYHLPRT